MHTLPDGGRTSTRRELRALYESIKATHDAAEVKENFGEHAEMIDCTAKRWVTAFRCTSGLALLYTSTTCYMLISRGVVCGVWCVLQTLAQTRSQPQAPLLLPARGRFAWAFARWACASRLLERYGLREYLANRNCSSRVGEVPPCSAAVARRAAVVVCTMWRAIHVWRCRAHCTRRRSCQHGGADRPRRLNAACLPGCCAAL